MIDLNQTKITAIIQGGLGNQLFQYACARKITAENGGKLVLNISSFRNDKKRSFMLDRFQIQGKILDSKIENILDQISVLSGKTQFVKENSFGFNKIKFIPNKDIRIEGYWQSEKYFASIRDVLLKELEVKGLPMIRNDLLEALTRESIAVHIRRGDYASDENLRKIYGVPSRKYYDEAIRIASLGLSRPIIVIFSDDTDWIRNNMSWPFNVIFASEIIRDHVIEVLAMSVCRRHIIANSTFGWWGAWLSRSPDKKVVAPWPWFKKEKIAPSDIVPADWIKIDSRLE